MFHTSDMPACFGSKQFMMANSSSPAWSRLSAPTGAVATCSWGYGMGYGSYGYGSYGYHGDFKGVGYGYGYGGGYGCVDLGASSTNYGHLRGVGPYANCKVGHSLTACTSILQGALTVSLTQGQRGATSQRVACAVLDDKQPLQCRSAYKILIKSL